MLALGEKFIIPIFKKRGIINSNNKINPDAARAAGYQVTQTSTPTIVDVTVPKKKYASIGTSQMRSGRRSTIQTSSSGLLSSASIGKKTLLGG